MLLDLAGVEPIRELRKAVGEAEASGCSTRLPLAR